MNYNLFENQKFTKILTILVILVIIFFAFKETRNSIKATDEEIKQLPSDVYKKEHYINKINIKTDEVPIIINNDNEKNNVLVIVHSRKKDTYKIESKGKELDLEFNKSSCEGLCLQEEQIIISLPSTYQLDFNIEANNSNVDINKITIKDTSTIKLNKGNITIKEIKDTNIITNVKQGEIKVNNNDNQSSKTLEINSEQSNIKIN